MGLLGLVVRVVGLVIFVVGFLWYSVVCVKVVNTAPVLVVPAGMYHTGMYTGIKTSMFPTSLNTSYTGQFRAIPVGTFFYFF